MALIRDGLLVLATVEPAYGLQLRNELAARTGRTLNGGQVYSTLERLLRDDLIHEVGRTHDDLALIAATPAGRSLAHEWLNTPEFNWKDMVAKVLLSVSLPGHSSKRLVDQTRQQWETALAESSRVNVSGVSLAVTADRLLAQSAISWLTEVADADDSGWAFSSERPPKGRRPKIPAAVYRNE